MNDIDKMVARRAEAIAQAGAILDRCKADGDRDLTQDEQAEFDLLHEEAAELQKKIDAARQRKDMHARQAAAVGSLNSSQGRRLIAVPGTEHINRADLDSIIPAGLGRGVKLRAFRGENAERNARQAGLWCLATLFGDERSRSMYAEQYGPQDLYHATLSTSSNQHGGYFVPEVMENAIIELMREYGVIRRNAEAVTMTSDSQSQPRWAGKMTAYYVAEGAAPTKSNPAWDLVTLVAKNLGAYTKMTRNLSEDSQIALAERVAAIAANAFAEAEDKAAFIGDGTSAYGGITGILPKLIEAGNAASLYTATGLSTLATLTLASFNAVVGMLPQYAERANPKWYMHKSVYYAGPGPLQSAAGGNTVRDIAEGVVPRFLGHDVEFVEAMPTAANVTSGVTGIVFGSLSLGVKFGERRGRTFEVGMENDDFTKQLMTLLSTQRYDVNVHTVVDPTNSSLPGPIIGLKLG